MITTAAAEFLYDTVAQWNARQILVVDDISFAFFKDVYPAIYNCTYKSGSPNSSFAQITSAVTAYADSFVTLAEKYIPANGSLAEQFNRDTGVPLSAVDLTWSYAAFVTMAQRKAGLFPASWGSRNAAPPPSVCSGASANGTYAAATAAGAPNVTSSCQINVVFDVNATTYYGENIYVIGNTTDLGAWNVDNSYPLGAGAYTEERPLWSVSAFLNAGETVSYKYVRQEDCDQPYIYESINRTLVVPACGSVSISTDDAWTGDAGTTGGC